MACQEQLRCEAASCFGAGFAIMEESVNRKFAEEKLASVQLPRTLVLPNSSITKGSNKRFLYGEVAATFLLPVRCQHDLTDHASASQ